MLLFSNWNIELYSSSTLKSGIDAPTPRLLSFQKISTQDNLFQTPRLLISSFNSTQDMCPGKTSIFVLGGILSGSLYTIYPGWKIFHCIVCDPLINTLLYTVCSSAYCIAVYVRSEMTQTRAMTYLQSGRPAFSSSFSGDAWPQTFRFCARFAWFENDIC